MNINDKKCPACGETGNIDSKFKCHSCGTQLNYDPERGFYTSEFITCPECKQQNKAKDNFCSKCGSTISTGMSVIEPEEREDKKSFFSSLQSKFIAVGVALLLGIGLTWTYFSFFNNPGLSGGPRIDVVFCIDTTGSMGDEIDNVKTQLKQMVKDIQQGNPKPVVRFGVVAFRDRGDEFVVNPFELTEDTKAIEIVINSLRAQGGGDHEESVNEALHVAIQEMNWDKSQGVSKMIFLIGDAGPHMDYDNDYDYRDEMEVASKRGITITTIACSGMDSSGEKVFHDLASVTNGSFEFLTYKQAFVDETGQKKVILYQKDKAYVVDEEYSDDSSWRNLGGADIFASEEKAEVAPSASFGDYSSGEGGAKYDRSGEMENNLTTVFTQSVQNEAKKQGVTY